MDKENEKSFSTKAGEFVANLFVACIAMCLGACMVAATISFIMWVL